MFTTFLASIGLIIGLGGLALGGYALWRLRQVQGEYQAMARRALTVGSGDSDPHAIRDVAVLHYDALEGMSGARSFSLALLNSHGDGVVVTSINGRTESRAYAKAITNGDSEKILSPEEYRVVRAARLGDGIGAAPTAPEWAPSDKAPAKTETSVKEKEEKEEEPLVIVVPGPKTEKTRETTEREGRKTESSSSGSHAEQ